MGTCADAIGTEEIATEVSIHVAIALAVVASVGFNVAAAFQKSAAVRLPKLSFPPERRALSGLPSPTGPG